MATKPMTPKQLEKAGNELYGINWQTPLAAAIGYQPRQVRRYYAGELPIPTVVFLGVVCLVAVNRGIITLPTR